MAVGSAAAISADGTAPEPRQTGEQVTMEVTIQEPFTEMPDQWTLAGQTDLASANWTVEKLNQRGNVVSRTDVSNATVTESFDIANDTDSIRVTVTGNVPSLSTFNYTDLSVENYTVMSLSQQNGNSFAEQWRSHRFTEDSRAARQAIDQASAAVENATGNAGQDDLDRAINAYDAGNFDNALSLAEDAEATAEENQPSDDGLPIALIAGAVVVLLIVVGGGLYYWQSQQEDTSRLQ
jgi:hypothetical protein